jgi:BMFP domain-containing protein YqiC
VSVTTWYHDITIQAPFAASQASGTGSRDDLQATMKAILQRLDKLDTIEERIGALEAKLPELQPL